MVVSTMGLPIWLIARRRGNARASLLLASLLVVALAGVTINIENYRGLWMLLALMEAYRRVISMSQAEPSVMLGSAGPVHEVSHAHAT